MIINILFTLLMLALVAWDLKSFGTKEHKDFKSLIMSIGILGTFAGIFVGLLGFDTNNILDSVPTLLDGLKTAFYTSIVGMGLAIGLSIYQKGKSKVAEDNEIDFIAVQARKLDELLHLRELSNVTLLLRDIKSEMAKKEDFERDLKDILKAMDISLNKAFETLASGASKELIKALEIVISDFNNNLKEQFGENFKQLNEATRNMLDWQENYKTQIEDNTHSLKEMQKTLQEAQDTMQQATQSINASKENLEQIQQYNQQNIAIQDKLIKALDMLKTLESSFEDKLHAIASLKESSIEALQTSKDFIQSLQQSKDNLHEHMEDYEKQLLCVFEKSCEQINNTHDLLKNQNNSILENIKDTYGEFKVSLHNANLEILESFKEASQTSNELAKVVNDDMQMKSNAMISLNENFKTNADSMLEKLDVASQKSIQHAQDMQEKTRLLYEEKFMLLDTKISNTTEVMKETLEDNAKNLKDFAKDSIQILSDEFKQRDTILQDNLKESHDNIANSIKTLHKEFQDKVAGEYANIQDIIVNTSKLTNEFLRDKTQEFLESNQTCLDSSVETTQGIIKEHMQHMQHMQETSFKQLEESTNNTRSFIEKSQNDNIETLKILHDDSLNRIENTIIQATKDTIDNLNNIQATYKENIESDIKFINENLQKEVKLLNETTQNTLNTMQEGLQTQHTKTTNSVSEILKNSSQYFIQASGDFTELLKGQYKRLNTTFDRQSQEIHEFLQSQTNTLKESLVEQNENLKTSLDTQTEQLQQDLTQKGEVLHQFLQTQTTCLDTNLQQMLSKFNKMLEHNYMNLSEMLEKDNNLIVKSLDSQAVNLSNTLIQSHKKLDDFLHSTYEKLSMNADSMLGKISGNANLVSKSLTLTGDSLKDNMETLMETISKAHKESQKIYDEKLDDAISKQHVIMDELKEKSAEFYADLNTSVKSFAENLSSTSSDINKNCNNILENIKVMQDKNQSLNKDIIQNTQDINDRFHANLEKNLDALANNVNEKFNLIMNKNENLLQSFEAKISSFGDTINTFENSSKTSFEGLNTNFKNLCIQYIKLMQASMQANIKSQSEATEKMNIAITSIKTNVDELSKSSNNLFISQKETLNDVVNHFKANTQELVKQGAMLHENLGANLDVLDSKMEKMTQSFANNYEWFLKKVKEIMGVS